MLKNAFASVAQCKIIRAFSDIEKPFLFSDLAALTAKSENKNSLYNIL